MVNTSLFLIFNLKAYLEELEKPKIYLIFGIVVGGQVALFLTFKLVFFKMVYEEENSGWSTDERWDEIIDDFGCFVDYFIFYWDYEYI